MRAGENKSKEKKVELDFCNHRIIIPLFIPNEEGYYKESFDIFKMCLLSVIKTANSKIKVSVVSNGSCASVHDKLLKLQKEGSIDQLVIENQNIGKINSILRSLRTAQERFITITDADVLFLNDWEQEVMSVFESFPKASAVSPIPVFRTQNHYTSNIIFDYLFSNKIKFSKVKNPEALTLFAKSIGWSHLDEKWKDFIMTIVSKNGKKAVVGCNHCVVTYKKEIFGMIPKGDSQYKLGGDSEGLYLDSVSQYYDGYRLAVFDNYAHHLGNTIQDWMLSAYHNLKVQDKHNEDIQVRVLKKSMFRHYFKNVIFKKLFSRKKIKKKYYISKGLSKNKVENFT